MSAEGVLTATAENYEEFLATNRFVVVFVFKIASEASKQLYPAIQSLSSDRADVLFLAVDAGREEALAKKLGVESVPTCLMYANGEMKGRLEGTKADRSTIGSLMSETVNRFAVGSEPTDSIDGFLKQSYLVSDIDAKDSTGNF
jgi:thioredoxin-like negative regulator of GroEL